MKSLLKTALTSLALVVAVIAGSSTEAHAGRYGNMKVYFMSPGSARIDVNGMSVGQVVGPSMSYDQVKPLSVERVMNPASGKGFANGANRVQLDLGYDIVTFTVTIPDPSVYPMNSDLTLTVFGNFWVLTDQGGMNIADGKIDSRYQ